MDAALITVAPKELVAMTPESAAAYAAGEARARTYYATGARTLIDEIDATELITWSGVDETALVGQLRP